MGNSNAWVLKENADTGNDDRMNGKSGHQRSRTPEFCVAINYSTKEPRQVGAISQTDPSVRKTPVVDGILAMSNL